MDLRDATESTLPPWLSKAYPFERSRIVVGDWHMNVVDTGSGPAILLMHGNPTWSYLWRKIIPLLTTAGFRVIAPDMVGLGLSDKPPSIAAHSMAFHVNNLTALVETLDLKEMVIVGQDWGGPQVAGMAAQLPDRVRGAVFANTSIQPPDKRKGATKFHRFANRPLVSTLAFRGFNFPMPMLPKVQGDPASMDPATLRAYRYPLDSWQHRAAPLALARMVPIGDTHPSIPELERCAEWATGFTGPVELVWGMRDPILGRSLSRLQALFPNAPVTKTQAGHFLQEEVPEELAAAILRVARAGL